MAKGDVIYVRDFSKFGKQELAYDADGNQTGVVDGSLKFTFVVPGTTDKKTFKTASVNAPLLKGSNVVKLREDEYQGNVYYDLFDAFANSTVGAQEEAEMLKSMGLAVDAEPEAVVASTTPVGAK